MVGFIDSDNSLFTESDIGKALLEIGAHDCDILFVHSDIMFGRPAGRFNRKEYLSELYQLLSELDVPNIIVPTFTYSFCNGEDYDVINSKTSMGAFNEYVRKQEGRYRTIDPLLSLSVPDSMAAIFENVSEHSLGKGSGLDKIHRLDGVKFLFLGAEMAECFTYVHYVEKMLEVPYRFDMSFEGKVIMADGSILHRRQYIHTQCQGVTLPEKYLNFEQEMQNSGYLRKRRIADKYVACISEADAYREIRQHIINDKFCFVDGTYSEADLIHRYTYSTKNGRITHC